MDYKPNRLAARFPRAFSVGALALEYTVGNAVDFACDAASRVTNRLKSDYREMKGYCLEDREAINKQKENNK